jgi:hypothetical protein
MLQCEVPSKVPLAGRLRQPITANAATPMATFCFLIVVSSSSVSRATLPTLSSSLTGETLFQAGSTLGVSRPGYGYPDPRGVLSCLVAGRPSASGAVDSGGRCMCGVRQPTGVT